MSPAAGGRGPLRVAKDKVVSLSYTLRDGRGEIFEQNNLSVPYLHGSGGGLFPKIEQALEGHAVGDCVSVSLSPDEGFGAHDPKLTFMDDIDNVPPEYRQVGAQLEAENASGEAMTFVVTRIANGKLTLDGNHPLAGQTVHFDVIVRDIRDATAEEIRAGQARPGLGAGPSTLQ